MEMYCLNVVHILRGAVTGVSHVTDHIPGSHHAALLKPLRIRIVLAQMRIVIVPLPVKAADADTPAPVLIPAQSLHITGLHRNDRCADLPHHVVAQMRPRIAIAAGSPKIIVMAVVKPFRDR